jgi:hypothetical protein
MSAQANDRRCFACRWFFPFDGDAATHGVCDCLGSALVGIAVALEREACDVFAPQTGDEEHRL